MVRIYYWVDVDEIRRLAEACENPYFGTRPRLVAAGRLTAQKGFDVLIDAMKVVHQALPAVRLTILGEGALKSDLKAQAERQGLSEVVQFAGFQSNPYPYFKHADLFVLSSRYEGLPNVILEALVLGTPVVAVDCPGGVREVLDGCALGWLVSDPDAMKLGQAIISALDSSKGLARDVDRVEQAISRFRIERAVRDYERLLSA
jgi:glycosyltransferase involved in cell wall biosynthesis